MRPDLPRRLARLPRHESGIVEAATAWSRLLGLAGLPRGAVAPGVGLHLPRTRSVHTFGMRFALDLVWLDGEGAVVRVDRGVRPCRVRVCSAARSVVEVVAGEA